MRLIIIFVCNFFFVATRLMVNMIQVHNNNFGKNERTKGQQYRKVVVFTTRSPQSSLFLANKSYLLQHNTEISKSSLSLLLLLLWHLLEPVLKSPDSTINQHLVFDSRERERDRDARDDEEDKDDFCFRKAYLSLQDDRAPRRLATGRDYSLNADLFC